MGFVEAVKTCLSKYAVFSGRAVRSEFWYFVLFLVLANLVGSLVSEASGEDGVFQLTLAVNFGVGSDYSWFTNFYSALFFIPFLSVTTRRLNDTDFPVGKLFAVGIAIFIVLSMLSKLANDQLPILLVVIPALGWIVFFIYVLARKSFAGTNIHGPNPFEVPQ